MPYKRTGRPNGRPKGSKSTIPPIEAFCTPREPIPPTETPTAGETPTKNPDQPPWWEVRSLPSEETPTEEAPKNRAVVGPVGVSQLPSIEWGKARADGSAETPTGKDRGCVRLAETPTARVKEGYIAAEVLTGRHSNLTSAARAAGIIGPGEYLDGSTRDHVAVATVEILAAAGVDKPRIARKVRELMDAKQVKFFAKDGVVQDEREVADNETQRMMTVEAAKMHGMYPRESDALGGPGSIHITVEQVAASPDQPTQAQRAVIRIGED